MVANARADSKFGSLIARPLCALGVESEWFGFGIIGRDIERAFFARAQMRAVMTRSGGTSF
jgi:hypothetical protein